MTVGTQLPFDRLVRAVDDWAAAAGRSDIVAQIGRSTYRPRAIEAHSFLDPAEFTRLQKQADLLVAHCGIGSMLAALEAGQPVLMMPRRHALGEHRNDHQWATAQALRGLAGVHIADDEQQLVELLERPEQLVAPAVIADKAPEAFTRELKSLLRTLC